MFYNHIYNQIMAYSKEFFFLCLASVMIYVECGVCYVDQCKIGKEEGCKSMMDDYSLTEENCCFSKKSIGFYPFPFLIRPKTDCFVCRICKEFFQLVNASINIQVINGGWRSWSDWSECSKTCGNGIKYRLRSCDNPIPSSSGIPCSGESTEIQKCKLAECTVHHEMVNSPVYGKWREWSAWSQCTKTCDAGTQYRMRPCDKKIPSNLESNCDGTGLEIQECNKFQCKKLGGWREWSEWSLCSRTCDVGSRVRTRNCINPFNFTAERICKGTGTEKQTCNINPCPVDGGWGTWSEWSLCSKSCNGGQQTRTRYCDNPIPQNSGKYCKRTNIGVQSCNVLECPVNDERSEWSAWSRCNKECGEGTRTRTRKCNDLKLSFNGKYCEGDETETQLCIGYTCPVDGSWSNWSEWSQCSETCNGGRQTRTRHCDNPIPKKGGKYCEGSKTENQICNIQKCSIDGGWSVWSDWSQCSQTCDVGDQIRTRQCNNPEPIYEGNYCKGSNTESKFCNERDCSDEYFSQWSLWKCYGCHKAKRDRKCIKRPLKLCHERGQKTEIVKKGNELFHRVCPHCSLG